MALAERPLAKSVKSFDNTIAFLTDKAVSVVPIERKAPQSPIRGSQASWEKRLEIVGLYNLTSLSLEQIGKQYGLTRERARQLNKEGIEELHAHASLDVRKAYRLESFSFGRPKPEKPRETPPKPIKPQPKYEQIIEELKDPILTDEGMQKIFNKITFRTYQMLHRMEILVTISSVAKAAGLKLTRNIPALAQRLKSQGLPLGEIERRTPHAKQRMYRSYFTLSGHYKDRALDILKLKNH